MHTPSPHLRDNVSFQVSHRQANFVAVYTTSVNSWYQVQLLAPFLNTWFGEGNWNFALDDADKILRIVSDGKKLFYAIRLLQKHGFRCAELND